jgi:hypothetical protein
MDKTKKRRGPGRPFKKGKGADRDSRINTAGAPPREESYAGTFRAIGDMAGEQLAEWGAEQLKEFRKLPPGVTLKTMTCLWAFASLARDFSPGVWNSIMDRVDGKVGDVEDRLRALEKLVEAKNGCS